MNVNNRDGSTKIQHYRGHEIRETLAGVWWRELGATMNSREAKSVPAAMRAINKKLGPVRINLKDLKQPTPPPGPQPKFVNARPWIEWGKKEGKN